MTDASSSKAVKAATRRVVAYGSNVFSQLAAQHLSTSVPQQYVVQDACRIIRACTFQTVYQTHFGEVRALGECAHLLDEVLGQMDFSPTNAPQTGTWPVFVGQDMVEAVLDTRALRCYFLDYIEMKVTTLEMVSPAWTAAAADGRGRCMAIDTSGDAFLFDSIQSFQAATDSTQHAQDLRDASRFIPYRYGHDGSLDRYDETAQLGNPRPLFRGVEAGNAHFVLSSEPSGKESSSKQPAIWVFGDARFGAVPLEPWAGTELVWKTSCAPANATAMDNPLLMPVTADGICRGLDGAGREIAAGGRHTLVRTSGGRVYGWGWNEDACLRPVALRAGEASGLMSSIVPEPIRIDASPSNGPNSDRGAYRVCAANGRSFVLGAGGLAIAGSNEFGCLALAPDLQGLEPKPRCEREFSQIKKTYDCVNGFQRHPLLNNDKTQRIVNVHATSLATFITLETSGQTHTSEQQ